MMGGQLQYINYISNMLCNEQLFFFHLQSYIHDFHNLILSVGTNDMEEEKGN